MDANYVKVVFAVSRSNFKQYNKLHLWNRCKEREKKCYPVQL